MDVLWHPVGVLRYIKLILLSVGVKWAWVGVVINVANTEPIFMKFCMDVLWHPVGVFRYIKFTPSLSGREIGVGGRS